MAELATLARPYAEALFEVARKGNLEQTREQLDAVAAVTADPALRQYAGAPSAGDSQVYELITSVLGTPLSDAMQNLLRMMIDNDRLNLLPEVAVQFWALASEHSGVSSATIESAFPIDGGALAEVVASLEKRFGRKLDATVQVRPQLIGGIRVVVGDEVLDTSVKARLEQMRAALTA